MTASTESGPNAAPLPIRPRDVTALAVRSEVSLEMALARVAVVNPDLIAVVLVQEPTARRLIRCALANGIARLLDAICEVSAGGGSCRHFGGEISPKAEGIGAGVAV